MIYLQSMYLQFSMNKMFLILLQKKKKVSILFSIWQIENQTLKYLLYVDIYFSAKIAKGWYLLQIILIISVMATSIQ